MASVAGQLSGKTAKNAKLGKGGEQKPPAQPPAIENDAKEAQETQCIICCDPIAVFAFGPCDHQEICSMCCLRLRALYKDLRCCLCKMDLAAVVVTVNPRKFEAYGVTGPPPAATKPGLVWDGFAQGYFAEPAYLEEFKRMQELRCPLCPTCSVFPQMKALKKHIQKEHSLFYCDVCVDNKKMFFSEQKLFTKPDLDEHTRPADQTEKGKTASGGWGGHPSCDFCNRCFYGLDELYEHMKKNHFTCQICERDNIKYQFYRSYHDLERHFRDLHFMCEDPSCLEKKYIVFRSEIDLKAHEMEVHLRHLPRGQKGRAAVIPISFNVLRANRVGEGVHGEEHYQDHDRRRHRQNDRGRRSVSVQPQTHDTSSGAVGTSGSTSVEDPGSSSSRRPNRHGALLAVPLAEGSRNLSCPNLNPNADAGDSDGVAAPARPPALQNGGGARSGTEESSEEDNTSSSRRPATHSARSAAPDRSSAQRDRPPPSGPPGLGRPGASSTANQGARALTTYHSQHDARPPPTDTAASVTSSRPSAQREQRDDLTASHSLVILPARDKEDMDNRNKVLIRLMKSLMGGNNDQFGEFRRMSAQFRTGAVSAPDYYMQFVRTFGSPRIPVNPSPHDRTVQHVFSELVSLLPDNDRREALIRAYNAADSFTPAMMNQIPTVSAQGPGAGAACPGPSRSVAAPPPGVPAPVHVPTPAPHLQGQWAHKTNKRTPQSATTCPVCKTSLLPSDLEVHMRKHRPAAPPPTGQPARPIFSNNDFPTLASGSQASPPARPVAPVPVSTAPQPRAITGSPIPPAGRSIAPGRRPALRAADFPPLG